MERPDIEFLKSCINEETPKVVRGGIVLLIEYIEYIETDIESLKSEIRQIHFAQDLPNYLNEPPGGSR